MIGWQTQELRWNETLETLRREEGEIKRKLKLVWDEKSLSKRVPGMNFRNIWKTITTRLRADGTEDYVFPEDENLEAVILEQAKAAALADTEITQILRDLQETVTLSKILESETWSREFFAVLKERALFSFRIRAVRELLRRIRDQMKRKHNRSEETEQIGIVKPYHERHHLESDGTIGFAPDALWNTNHFAFLRDKRKTF